MQGNVGSNREDRDGAGVIEGGCVFQERAHPLCRVRAGHTLQNVETCDIIEENGKTTLKDGGSDHERKAHDGSLIVGTPFDRMQLPAGCRCDESLGRGTGRGYDRAGRILSDLSGTERQWPPFRGKYLSGGCRRCGRTGRGPCHFCEKLTARCAVLCR